MNKIKPKKVQVKTNLRGTINSLEIGEAVLIKERQSKSTTVRSCVSRISQKSSKRFMTTEKGMIGEIKVIRIK